MNQHNEITKGGFTLPGEAGYEDLTLELAKRWGADVIRDSDGTVLSDDILNAGYGIYSTICLIRDHNAWAKVNMDKLQQTFLVTSPVVANSDTLIIDLMEGFFKEQFLVNDSKESLMYWQVYDRTTDTLIDNEKWSYQPQNQSVVITGICPWHKYTVSFMAYRIWEEISMYNHTTNNWNKEHLMQIDPMHKETREYLLTWMDHWCKQHEQTTVVRFTSMFYNFVWMWGSNEKNRYLFSDWASYDFTVSPLALNLFKETYGYALTAEDFIHQGKFHVTHMPADQHKLDWMEFINNFVVDFGKQLIDVVHNYGKLAYVFYDDSWVGVEPYHKNFEKFGFDGIIKCVFSGFEVRLCAGVKVNTHELRLHPYLFPVGLGGAPTFMDGGNPTLDAKNYWISVRRALLREPIERIGLGGYLHLVEDFPDFTDYIEKIANEFRRIRQLHTVGKPIVLKPRVAVLHSWGSLRSWTLSGHFHETYMHDLIHINESLSGLPVDVKFINFEDVKQGALEGVDVVINAGTLNTAWSGGKAWEDPEVIERITRFVYEGKAFIGVNEPSAVNGYDTLFRLAHVLGVDMDLGDRVSHGRYTFLPEPMEELEFIDHGPKEKKNIYLTDGLAKVLKEENGLPVMTSYEFGKGLGIYLTSYEHSIKNARTLLNIILYAAGESFLQEGITDNVNTESAYYEEDKILVMINNSDTLQKASVTIKGVTYTKDIPAFDTVILSLE